MAPVVSQESSAPLADYFFIAGIESAQILEDKSPSVAAAISSPAPVDTTIEENEVLETDNGSRPKSSEGLNSRDSNASSRKAARLSFEARKSISSLLGSESRTESNRSSATLKGVQLEGALTPDGLSLAPQPPTRPAPAAPSSSPLGPPGPGNAGPGLNEVDFDNALRKFAAERESFLDEIQFSAGALPQVNKPKARAKMQRIFSEEAGGIKSGVGSIRRRLSTMNSLKKQPSINRHGTTFIIYCPGTFLLT
jgi:hypothetical protein